VPNVLDTRIPILSLASPNRVGLIAMIDTKLFRNHVIDIKLPVADEYASVLRLFIAGIGNLWGLTLDEIEDLKLTASEAFLDIVSRSAESGEHVSVRWRVDADRAVVTLTDPSRTIRKLAQSPVLMLLAEKGGDVSVVDVPEENRIELGFRIHANYSENGLDN